MRTNLSLANSFRTLRAYLAEITRQIGVGLGAAIRHAVVGLNMLMKYVLKASQAFATFMQKIFGKYEGGASFVDMDMSGMSDDMGDFADGADNAADGLDDAADSAEKLKKDLSVLPFDELNQLNKDQEKTSSSKGKGAGSGGGIGGLGDVGDFDNGMFAQAVGNAERELTDFEKFLKDWHDKCAASLNAKDWEGLGKNIAWGLNQGIDALYDALDPEKAAKKINPWLDAFSTTVNSLTKHLEWEKMGGAIGRGITILVNAANRLLDPETGIDFEALGGGLGNGFMGAVRNINWTGVGNLISNKFMVAWRIFKGFVDEIDATEIGEAIRDTIGGAIDKLDTEVIGGALGNFVEKVATAIKIGFGEKKHWTTFGQKLADGLKAFFRAVKGKDIADAINVLMDAILTTLGTVLEDDELKSEVAKDVGDFLVNINWGNVGKLAAPLIALKLLGGLWTPFKTSLLTGITTKAAGFFKGFTVPGFVSGLSTALLYANPAMLGKIGDDAWNMIQKTVIGQFLLDVDSSIDEIFWNPLMNLFSFERARSHWETAKADFSTGGMNAVLGIGEGFQAGYWAISEPVYNLFDTFIGGILGIFTGQTPLITESAAEMARGIDGAAVTAAQDISTATTDAKNTLSTNLTEMQTKEGEYATATSTSAYTATMAYQNIVDKLGVLGQQHHTDLVENAKSAVETFESAVTQGASSMSSSWYTLTQDEQGHTQSLVESLKAQTASIQTWEQDLTTLSKAGVDEGFLTELARMGTEGTPAVQSALEQIEKEGGVEELNSSWQALINAQGMMDDVGKTLKEAGVTNISESFGVLKKELETDSKELPNGIKSGLEMGAPLSKDAMGKLAKDMNDKYRTFWRIGSPSKEMESNSSDIVTGVVNGIKNNESRAMNVMERMAKNMMSAFLNKMDVSGMISKAFSKSNIQDAYNTAFDAGVGIGEQLAKGIQSVKIPTPEIYVASYSTETLDTGEYIYTYSIPNYKVGWYAKGGLFTDKSIIGLAEAGAEAALPLENKRAMNMIANAIIDNADGGFGMDADEMANAVARGYAMAQMMNQGNERPIQFNATLYTEDNEVLARAVARGQESIDYRNNATPKLSY